MEKNFKEHVKVIHIKVAFPCNEYDYKFKEKKKLR